jgi:predicted histone-like DNA-binding protein
MAINYKIREKTEPGVAGGGAKKFYATMATNGEATIDDIVKQIEMSSTFSEPDIRGTIYALENAIQDFLANSKIVRLETLGSLYPTLSSKGENSADEVDSGSIKKVGVYYRPGKRILETINNTKFHKVK